MKLQFLFAAYGAAAASFFASLLRDYVVITQTDQSKDFFQLFYVVSMAAGFGVNAIALGRGFLGRIALALLALMGVIVILLLLPASLRTPYTVVLLVSVLLMWLAGAQWARFLVERGWVFSGRVREAVSSLALVGLVVAGLAVFSSFFWAVAAGTFFSWSVWKFVRLRSSQLATPLQSATGIKALAGDVVATNLATFAVTYWALLQTSGQAEAFGYDAATVIRFAMYLYQVLIIGSVVVVSARRHLLQLRHVRALTSVAIFVFFGSLFLPLNVALFLTPLSAAAVHYGVVLLLQRGR